MAFGSNPSFDCIRIKVSENDWLRQTQEVWPACGLWGLPVAFGSNPSFDCKRIKVSEKDKGLWPDFEPFDFDHGPRALA